MEEADNSDFSVISDFSSSYVSASVSPRASRARVALRDLLEDSPRQVLRDVSYQHTQRISELEKENRCAMKRTGDVEEQYRKKFQSLKKLTEARESKLKQRIDELQTYQHQLSKAKDDIRSLDFSLEASDMGVLEEQQTLAQFVLARVQDTLLESRMKSASMTKELQDLRSELLSKSEDVTRLRVALDTSGGGNFETAIRETAQELSRCKLQIAELQRENTRLLAAASGVSSPPRCTQAISVQYRPSRRVDESYLMHDIQSITDRLQTSEHENTRFRRLLDEARTKADGAYRRHVRERDEQQSKFDERLAAFTERLKRESEKDLNDVRVTQKESFEREIRSLRTERDFSSAEIEKLRTKHDEDSRQHDALVKKHRCAVRGFEDTIQGLRNSLRTKQFDVDRVQRCLDETSNQKERLRDENNRLSDKLEHAQSEVRDLQDRARSFAFQQRKLSSSTADPVSPKSGEAPLPQVSPALFRCTAIPLTTSNAKNSNAMETISATALADPASWQTEKQSLVKQIHALTSEVGISKSRLSHVDRPTRALIDTIQQREKQLETAETLMVKLRNELIAASTEVKRAHIEKQHLREDLRAMCDMKVELDSIRASILASDAFTAANPTSTHTSQAAHPYKTTNDYGLTFNSHIQTASDFPIPRENKFGSNGGARSFKSHTLLPRFQEIQDMHCSPLKSPTLYAAHMHTNSETENVVTSENSRGRPLKPKLPRAHSSPASLQQWENSRNSLRKEHFDNGNHMHHG